MSYVTILPYDLKKLIQTYIDDYDNWQLLRFVFHTILSWETLSYGDNDDINTNTAISSIQHTLNKLDIKHTFTRTHNHQGWWSISFGLIKQYITREAIEKLLEDLNSCQVYIGTRMGITLNDMLEKLQYKGYIQVGGCGTFRYKMKSHQSKETERQQNVSKTSMKF
jgi:hypothetical protein